MQDYENVKEDTQKKFAGKTMRKIPKECSYKCLHNKFMIKRKSKDDITDFDIVFEINPYMENCNNFSKMLYAHAIEYLDMNCIHKHNDGFYTHYYIPVIGKINKYVEKYYKLGGHFEYCSIEKNSMFVEYIFKNLSMLKYTPDKSKIYYSFREKQINKSMLSEKVGRKIKHIDVD
jgi:hypothetical protein